ncbi:MAG: response regulator [Rhizomicrobium sp.]
MADNLIAREIRPSSQLRVRSQGGSTGGPVHARGANAPKAFVFVVEDDTSVREGLLDLLQSVGLQTKAFASATELLSMELPKVASCFVVDIRLPGLSGLDFQARMIGANIRIPIIFMTGHADIPMTVRAMKAGAVDFLTKPFREQEMLDAVTRALELDGQRLDNDQRTDDVFARFETLSQREREVMELVTAGLMNKQVAARIGVVESTVKIHRAQVMKKMRAKSLADLVRMAELLWLAPAHKAAPGAVPDKPRY